MELLKPNKKKFTCYYLSEKCNMKSNNFIGSLVIFALGASFGLMLMLSI
jgi:hypothetical protein